MQVWTGRTKLGEHGGMEQFEFVLAQESVVVLIEHGEDGVERFFLVMMLGLVAVVMIMVVVVVVGAVVGVVGFVVPQPPRNRVVSASRLCGRPGRGDAQAVGGEQGQEERERAQGQRQAVAIKRHACSEEEETRRGQRACVSGGPEE
jgi:hypothetical protein